MRSTVTSGVVIMAGLAPSLAIAASEGSSNGREAVNQTDPGSEIVVTAHSDRQIGNSRSASEGLVNGDELLERPVLRTSELAEAVPGMIAVQHSGGGKAAQYLIRGYNLDHGTDFSITIDNMPFNLRSQAHGQGYLDLNGLIPETVAAMSYRKGPYAAQDGDFSAVAAASITTRDDYDRPFATVTAGSYGYRRVAGGGSFDLASGTMLLAGDYTANNGPWALAEHLRHYAGFAKYSQETGLGTFHASLSLYDATWRPTEQIPVRAIGDELTDRFDTLDPYLKGSTDREVLNLGLEGQDWTLSAYVQHYAFDLFSNFTFYLEDPVNGDELEQAEDRWTFGGRVARRLTLTDQLGLTLGLDVQVDDINGLGLFHTLETRRLETRSLMDVRETSLSSYAEASWKPIDVLDLTGGVRIDHYAVRTWAKAGEAESGEVHDTIATPKFAASLTLLPEVAIYANYGEGFHSNTAQGVVSSSDPTPIFARTKTYEMGARLERGALNLSLTHWWSRASSELVYSGDDGTVEATGPSRRRGLELVGHLQLARWLDLDGVMATNHARFVNAPGADRVPNALESAGEFGATAKFAGSEISARVRYLGAHPLVEDNSVRSPATTVVNLRFAHSFKPVDVSFDVLNLFNTRRADADYYYASRLPDEPLQGVEGVHSRTVEPRQVRVTLTAHV